MNAALPRNVRIYDRGALLGVKVLDVSTLFAAPFAARVLADHGADVLKVEHPSGDPLRRFGRQLNDVGLTWKVVNRNKTSCTLDLHTPDGQETLRRLATDADIMFENFRPGVLNSCVSAGRVSRLHPCVPAGASRHGVFTRSEL